VSMPTFTSYYWNPDLLAAADLRAAASSLGSDDWKTRIDGFASLLRSGDSAAQGIALDQYVYAESTARHGGGNPFESFAADVRDVARRLLTLPPIPQRRPDGSLVAAANQASGLGALAHLGDPSDFQNVESILLSSEDVDALSMACFALPRVTPSSGLGGTQLANRLAAIAADPKRPSDLRLLAMGALGAENSTAVLDLVADVAERTELPFSAYAAETLADADLPRYRPLLDKLAASWPDNAPYPASRVRNLLANGT